MPTSCIKCLLKQKGYEPCPVSKKLANKCSPELALILLYLHLLHNSLQMHTSTSVIFLAKYHLVQVESHHNMNILSVVIRNRNGRNTTTYHCKQCKVVLRVVPCFELYHTYIDPTRYL